MHDISRAPALRIVNLHKAFAGYNVLAGVSLEITEGEVLAVIGASGSGKTTLLRCVSGLEEYSGEILVDGAPLVRRRSRSRPVKPGPALSVPPASCSKTSTCSRI